MPDADILIEEFIKFIEAVHERRQPPYDFATEAANAMELYDKVAAPLPPELGIAEEIIPDAEA